jgi:hypothetical protein
MGELDGIDREEGHDGEQTRRGREAPGGEPQYHRPIDMV